MAKQAKPKYRGVLSEPMVRRFPPPVGTGLLAVASEEDAVKIQREIDEKWVADMSARLSALYEHYGIDPSHSMAQLELILALARDHVKGFEVVSAPPRGSGRPGKWKGSDKSAGLYADVKTLERKGHSAHAACRILATTAKYATRYGGETQSNLYRRYQEALSNLPPLLKRVIEPSRAEGAPVDDWLVQIYAIEAENRWVKALADRRKSDSEN